MTQVVIQYRIEGMGSTRDLDRAIAIEDLMNECLERAGLGRCDGHDIGSGTLNIFCDIIEGTVAGGVLVDCLRQNGQLDGAVIARRNRAGDDEYVVFWPENFTGEFDL